LTDAPVAPGSRPRVFLSYAREDRPAAEPLIRALEAAGYDVWWDGLLIGGVAFARTTEDALETADAVVVLWSRRSCDSHWVRDEATRGRDRGCLVPVSLDGAEPPLGFRQFQVIDLRPWNGEPNAPEIRAIVRALEVVRQAPPGAAGTPHRPLAAGQAAAYPAAQPPAHPSPPLSASSSRSSSSRGLTRRTALIGGGAALVAALGAGVYTWQRRATPRAAATTNSLVVLPFKNLSGNPEQDYFSDGLSAEVRAALARNRALRVIAQVSSDTLRQRNVDAVQMAAAVGVAYLLDGSVRLAGSTFRIVAELIDGATGFSRWTETFDRPIDDVLAVQSEIASAVETALSATLAAPDGPTGAQGGSGAARPQTPGGTSDVVAFDAYLRGRALFDQADGEAGERAALAQFDAAIARDAKFAAARAARARSLTVIANQYAPASETRAMYAEALREAEAAVTLAPDFAGAHSTLAFTRFQGHLDVAGARAPYERSRELGPGDATVMGRYALYSALTGRADAALAAMNRATDLDPLNPLIHRAAGTVHYAARNYAAVDAPVRHAMTLNPKLAGAHAILGNAQLMLGRAKEARAEYLLERHDLVRLPGLAIVEQRLGDVTAARAALAELVRTIGDGALYQQAQVHAQWGEAAASLAVLERARAAGDSGLIYLRTDPLLDPVRTRPEFQRMLARLGFE
jgi:TolB-like protein/Flp pilus assembly protein TadD